LVSPTVVIESIKKTHKIDSIVSIQLIEILGKPFYQVQCLGNITKPSHEQHEMAASNHMANAETGELRGPLTKEEAVEIAKLRFKGEPVLKSVEYLTNTDGHHEYRKNPLPAYAVSFQHPSQTTVYIATELGTVQKFRNNTWRMFDFLWMMHTMDYKGRDNFGNILLRIFSIMGLITVMSGFALYVVSSKRFRFRKSDRIT
jgi:hypothetical protein